MDTVTIERAANTKEEPLYLFVTQKLQQNNFTWNKARKLSLQSRANAVRSASPILHPMFAFDMRGNIVNHGMCGCCQYIVLWWNRAAGEISSPVSDDFKSAHRTNLLANRRAIHLFAHLLRTLIILISSTYPVIPLASSLHFNRPPGIGFLLNSLSFVFKLQSIGTWFVGFSSWSLSAASSVTPTSSSSFWWSKLVNELVSFVLNAVFALTGAISLTFANKSNTESSDTYSVVSGVLWRDFFLSDVNRSLRIENRYRKRTNQ